VVLVAMMPEMPGGQQLRRFRQVVGVRSGAIFRKTGIGAGEGGAGLHHAGQEGGEGGAALQVAQFSVLGEETLTVAKSTCGPQVASTRAKSAARSGLSLFAPRFRPTGTAGSLAGGEAGGDRLHPVVVEAEAVDGGAVLGQAEEAGFGVARLRAGVAAPTSMKPKPARERGAITVAFLS
jgi:hypothetical protein